MPRIFGNKIMLREYVDSDYEHIRRWVNDPKIVDTLSDSFLYPHSEKQTRDFLDRAMGRDWKGFVIAHCDTEEYIGQIDFVRLDLINGFGEIGIVIGNENNHGKGYGTEALQLFMEFGFRELRLNRIELVCWEHNVKGRRAYEKAGFVQEGVRRKKRYRHGQYYDEINYGVLRSEWEGGRTE